MLSNRNKWPAAHSPNHQDASTAEYNNDDDNNNKHNNDNNNNNNNNDNNNDDNNNNKASTFLRFSLQSNKHV